MSERQTGRKTTSVFRGVHRTSGSGWGSKYSGKRIAATCKTAEEAALAYDEYLRVHLPEKCVKFSNFNSQGKFRNPLGLNLKSIVDIVGKEEAINLRRRTIECNKLNHRAIAPPLCSSQLPVQAIVLGSPSKIIFKAIWAGVNTVRNTCSTSNVCNPSSISVHIFQPRPKTPKTPKLCTGM